MTGFLADTLVVTGLLIAAVLILRRPAARFFGAQAAYMLWVLPLLRLVLPPIELPASMAPAAPLAAPSARDTVVFVAGDAATVPAAPAFDWGEAVVALWIAGAVLFLGWRVLGYRRMRRDLLAEARPVGTSGAIRMVETPAVSAPVAFGVLDKVVALPVGFMAWHDRRARDLALAHEFAHHAGHDLFANMAAQPLLALHWFNPLAWFGWRAMRRDQEAACDARVLAGQGGAIRADYGRLIAGIAGGPRLALAAPMAGPAFLGPVLGEKSIIHRLRSLTMPEPTRIRRRLGLALLGSAALALPLTATIGYAAADVPPPVPPSAPTAPFPPADGAKAHKRIVIMDNPGGGSPEVRLYTREVKKDGRTVILKTAKPLTDAEAEARIATAMASLPEVPEAPLPPVPPAAPDAPSAPEAPRVSKIVVMDAAGKPTAMVMAAPCAGKGEETVTGADGKQMRVTICTRMRIAGAEAKAHAAALEGLKRARDRIAKNPKMPTEVRDEVLRDLDAEIADMGSEG